MVLTLRDLPEFLLGVVGLVLVGVELPRQRPERLLHLRLRGAAEPPLQAATVAPQIQVNPTKLSQEMDLPVYSTNSETHPQDFTEQFGLTLRDLPEFLLCVFGLVLVGVVLPRQRAERLLHLRLGGVLADPQNLSILQG